MENMHIYEAVRKPPEGAIKPISGGRLSGKSDINPMWRIKAMTEQFGPCGIGWAYEITRQWTEAGANGEAAAFCNILLYVKEGEAWSKGIPGVGGSMFTEKEKSGIHTNDECYKMALTDAISVACKALGVAADVYWDRDRTKYSKAPEPVLCPVCGNLQTPRRRGEKIITAEEIIKSCGNMCLKCFERRKKNEVDPQ